MLILGLAMIQAAATAASPSAPDPSQAVPVPMTREAWASMDQRTRMLYADVTIQALRRNPVLSRCEALTPVALAAGITAAVKPGEPLMNAVAVAAYGLCPPA